MAMAGVMANVDMKADNVNNLPDIEDIVTGLQGSKRKLFRKCVNLSIVHIDSHFAAKVYEIIE